jgi:cholestenol delta-isomerase
MDTRYWPLDDPTVAWISYLELAVYIPLGYFWYKGVVEGKWFQHFHALLVSTFQLMGCILYLGCEWHCNFSHLPSPDWPWPRFDSYLKIKYFWLIFVGCNGVWIVVPLLVYWHTFSEMSKLPTTAKSKTH